MLSKFAIIFILILKFDLKNCQNNDDSSKNSSQWTLTNLIPKNYDKHSAPLVNNVPTIVGIGIEVYDLVSVIESGQSFTLDLSLSLKWTDFRLNLPKQMANDTPIILDSSWKTRIWTPDIYFSNALEAKVLNVLNPILYYSIFNDQSIVQIIRMVVKFQCKMDLSQYPQDVQYCPIDLMSLTHNNRSLILKWEYFLSPPYDDNPKFRIKQTSIDYHNKHNYLGNFVCLTAKMKLVRRVSYYIIQVYAPTFLTTISSFTGFWIPVLAWPARVALLVTPLLTLVTQNININSQINVSYIVALHWWMTFCIFFVFMGLIEFAVAIAWAWLANDRKDAKDKLKLGLLKAEKYGYTKSNLRTHCVRFMTALLITVFGNIDYTKEPLNRNKVDYAARIIFPVFYTVFVLIYIFSTVCPWAVDYNW